ncbi:MAG: hypothetical protein ACOC3F_02130 [Desulfosudaceae bacterium]
MSDSTEDIRKWMGSWKQASAALQEQRKAELRALDYYEKNRRLLDEMLQYACDHSRPRPVSGLVEQQRWFMKLRDRQ